MYDSCCIILLIHFVFCNALTTFK